MVYTGKPSKGCDVCRNRRIKCDEAQPSCGYCTKRKIQCPGSKSQFDVSWRDQTLAAKKNVQRRVNAATNAASGKSKSRAQGAQAAPAPSTASLNKTNSAELTLTKSSKASFLSASSPSSSSGSSSGYSCTWSTSSSSDSSESSVDIEDVETSTTLLPHLPQDFTSYAISFYYSTYALTPQDSEINRCFIGCLRLVWLPTDTSSPLVPALTAVASIVLEAWSLLSPGTPSAYSGTQYVKAMTSLRRRLANTNKPVTDDVLMAALMLNVYEGVQSFLNMKPPSNIHVNGTAALVESRKRLPYENDTSQKLLMGARSLILGRSMRNGDGVPEAVNVLSSMTTDTERTPAWKLDDINIGFSKWLGLTNKILKIIQEGGIAEIDVLTGLLTQASDLDVRYIDWLANVPDGWRPRRVDWEDIPPSVRQAGIYGNYCTVSKSLFATDLMNGCACSRVRLHLTILKIITVFTDMGSLNDDLVMLGLTAHTTIQKIADDICACIPFYLGDRLALGRIDDYNIKYPVVPGEKLPMDHHVVAAAEGGWFLMSRLPRLLVPEVVLRPGQKEWIQSQIQRVIKVYAVMAFKR